MQVFLSPPHSRPLHDGINARIVNRLPCSRRNRVQSNRISAFAIRYGSVHSPDSSQHYTDKFHTTRRKWMLTISLPFSRRNRVAKAIAALHLHFVNAQTCFPFATAWQSLNSPSVLQSKQCPKQSHFCIRYSILLRRFPWCLATTHKPVPFDPEKYMFFISLLLSRRNRVAAIIEALHFHHVIAQGSLPFATASRRRDYCSSLRPIVTACSQLAFYQPEESEPRKPNSRLQLKCRSSSAAVSHLC